MSVTIEMPKLSDTMSVGTVVKWHKNVGDEVSNGDTLAEIETDKATMELENFEDGVLLKILVGEGEEAPIGSPLAYVGEKGEEIEIEEAPSSKKPEDTTLATLNRKKTKTPKAWQNNLPILLMTKMFHLRKKQRSTQTILINQLLLHQTNELESPPLPEKLLLRKMLMFLKSKVQDLLAELLKRMF